MLSRESAHNFNVMEADRRRRISQDLTVIVTGIEPGITPVEVIDVVTDVTRFDRPVVQAAGLRARMQELILAVDPTDLSAPSISWIVNTDNAHVAELMEAETVAVGLDRYVAVEALSEVVRSRRDVSTAQADYELAFRQLRGDT